MKPTSNHRTTYILLSIFALAFTAKIIFFREEKSVSAKTIPFSQAKSEHRPKHQTQSTQNSKHNEISPDLLSGEFTLKVNLYLNKYTTVKYIIPIDPKTRKPRESANNIVFYAPYNGDAGRIRVNGLPPWVRIFAEKYGYTVFSLIIEADVVSVGDQTKYYIYKQAGWHSVIIDIKKRLEAKYKLDSRPMAIVGESSGGSLAQRLAVHHPKQVAIVAWNGGGNCLPLDKRHANTAFMGLSTWGDTQIKYNLLGLSEQAIKNQVQVLTATTPPNWKSSPQGGHFHHAAGLDTYKLFQAFVDDIFTLRKQNNGDISPFRWPYQQMSHDGKLQYFPSKTFLDLWDKLPYSTVINQQKVIVMPAQSGIECIALVFLERDLSNCFIMEDHLAILAKHGVLAIAPIEELTRENIINIIKGVLENSAWQKLPIYIIGAAWTGQHIIEASEGSARIKRVSIFDPESYSDIHLRSISGFDSTNPIPVFYYTTNSAIQPQGNTQLKLFDIKTLSSNKWYDLLPTTIIPND